MSSPLTPPFAPLIPRSQPPRPTPASHSHSSPVISSHAHRRDNINRPPSAPLFSSDNSAPGLTGAAQSSTNTSTNSSHNQYLITPSTSNINTGLTLGPPIGLSGNTKNPIGIINSAASTSTGFGSGSASASGSGGGGGGGMGGDKSGLSKQGLTASSSTSVSGLLSTSSGVISTPQHQLHNHNHNHNQGQSSNTNTNATTSTSTSVNQTPQTGASKMAAAAKRGLDGSGLPNSSSAAANAGGIAAGTNLNEQQEEGHPLSEKSLRDRDYQTIHTLNRLFHLPSRWKLIRPLGQGAYGLVINVQDSYSGEPVAVKCITRVFDKVILARRALREITLLRHFGGHENLTGLIDLDSVWEGYNEIYLYMEPMEADLHQIVRSGQPLSNSHIQYFLYQILRGMKYIHTANVIHRDLKPGNLLVNSDCELKICDFGLARGFKPFTGEDDQNGELKLTEYVATRWYRAPEIMLSNRRYTTAIDVWSIGCILAELLGLKPIFKGKDYVDQLNLILGVLGTPNDETLARVSSEKALAYIKTLPHSPTVQFSELFPEADPDALDLLSELLAFDPSQRIDVIEALSHPYLATYHDETDEPACPELFSKWEQVESLTTIEELKEAISREIEEFRQEVRTMDDDDEEYYDEMGEGDETWRVDGLDEGEQVNNQGSSITDTPLIIQEGEALPVPDQNAGPSSASKDISPKANFTPLISSSPLAKRQSIIAAAEAAAGGGGGKSASVSPERRKSSSTSGIIHQIPNGSGYRSLPRTRDHSPSTPATALSEESFGNPFSASGSGRASRRQSGHSTSFSMSSGGTGGNRRPNSFLFNPFGQGMTPMTHTNQLPLPATSAENAPAPGPTSATATATATTAHDGGIGTRERGGSGYWSGRRSRAPSQSGSMGLLIRQLSVVDFESKFPNHNHNEGDNEEKGGIHKGELDQDEVPPMTVSPSDAPPSEVPKNFSK
ncbi:uncharacterized protein IL334_007229 [Kwoniella shivajii]|uniref:Mitogen-activated protein kinase n=1 Tax=Kwoniella shivajii TaxID=564305 RepID=A0ABZ1DAC1_9TREE|nr:hypothetical protein IL334_007229 [Kwoniella shivajii]